MEFMLEELVLETTRNCNLHCAHCMRGDKQELDTTTDIIDAVFNNPEIKGIKTICFSGGEPTLNPDIIVYTIQKIINEKLNVGKIVLTTNGQIYNQQIMDVLNKFNEYRNNYMIKLLEKETNLLKIKEIRSSLNNNVIISFSQDQFHQKIERDVKLQYFTNAKGLRFGLVTKMEEEEIYKTGYSKVGKKFDYQLQPIKYYKESDYYVVSDLLYVTAKGNITSEGMGQYSDMDICNLGNVSNITIQDILKEYGTPVFGTKEITGSQKKTKN